MMCSTWIFAIFGGSAPAEAQDRPDLRMSCYHFY